jgi:hypothetical protein
MGGHIHWASRQKVDERNTDYSEIVYWSVPVTIDMLPGDQWDLLATKNIPLIEAALSKLDRKPNQHSSAGSTKHYLIDLEHDQMMCDRFFAKVKVVYEVGD